jgi:hypothetical protein
MRRATWELAASDERDVEKDTTQLDFVKKVREKLKEYSMYMSSDNGVEMLTNAP